MIAFLIALCAALFFAGIAALLTLIGLPPGWVVMGKPITFIVDGNPAPKQSFRYSQRGSYQTFRVHTWQIWE